MTAGEKFSNRHPCGQTLLRHQRARRCRRARAPACTERGEREGRPGRLWLEVYFFHNLE